MAPVVYITQLTVPQAVVVLEAQMAPLALALQQAHLLEVLTAAAEVGLKLLMKTAQAAAVLLELFGVQTDRSQQRIQESYNGSSYTH